jgi:hypothetical protein
LLTSLKRSPAGLLALAALAILGGATGCGRKDDPDKQNDPLAPWQEIAAEIEERPGASEAKAYVSGGRHIILFIELDYREITTERIKSLDTGITREFCAAAPSPVELRIEIPGRGGQEWQGFYVPEGGEFTTFRGSTELEPRFEAGTATFVIYLPAEG